MRGGPRVISFVHLGKAPDANRPGLRHLAFTADDAGPDGLIVKRAETLLGGVA